MVAAEAASSAASAATGGEVRSLLRRILRVHRQRLSHDVRVLADRFVGADFRYHQSIEPAQVPAFVKSWQEYYERLLTAKSDEEIGKDLSAEEIEALGDEQLAELNNARESAEAIGRGVEFTPNLARDYGATTQEPEEEEEKKK